jgi:uncharacterized protein with von Willebrand factor type A (vWA) domain
MVKGGLHPLLQALLDRAADDGALEEDADLLVAAVGKSHGRADIDKLLRRRGGAKTAQIDVIDLKELARYTEPGDLEAPGDPQRQVQEYLRHRAEEQGLEQARKGCLQMTRRAYRLFRSKLPTRTFEQMQASRSGRHQGPVVGEGATETEAVRPYGLGDSVTHMDVPATFTNALPRAGPGLPVRPKAEGVVIHKTRNTPGRASAVPLDRGGPMRYDEQHVNAKRMGLALGGLVRGECPGDSLQLIERYTFARPRHVSEGGIVNSCG